MKKQVSNKAAIDVFGKAISAYYQEQDETPILVHSPDFDDDEILVPYLFLQRDATLRTSGLRKGFRKNS